MRTCALLAALFLLAAQAVARTPPLTIEELRAKEFSGELTVVESVKGGPGFDAVLVSYVSAGHKVYALVAVPQTPRPSAGFPVLIANHGFHPDPPNYGVTADGERWRPGDYYRPVPAAYARHGFLVVMPDYRGHNTSEGGQFATGSLAPAYFSEDVLALVGALGSLEDADPKTVFLWGHSMGGDVSLRALLATDRVKAAAIWSLAGGDVWERAYYRSRRDNPLAPDDSATDKRAVTALRREIAELDADYDWRAGEPREHLQLLTAPVIIHHSIDDKTTPYHWATRLVQQLYRLEHPYELYTYPGSAHFLQGEQFTRAVERDVRFFRRFMVR